MESWLVVQNLESWLVVQNLEMAKSSIFTSSSFSIDFSGIHVRKEEHFVYLTKF